MDPAGVITLAMSGSARRGFSITSGGGTYRPAGRIDIRSAGVAGPMARLRSVVTGTATRAADRARGGQSGLRHRPSRRHREGARGRRRLGDTRHRPVRLRPVRRRRGHSIRPRADDDRGPPPALRRDEFTGRVVRTAAGPFVGHAGHDRPGPQGTVQLAAAGRYQRADIDATANGARMPGEKPILIQRGIVQATVILYRRAANRRRRPARRARQRQSSSSPAPGSASTIAAATAPPSSSPRGAAASRSGSRSMPRSRPT